MPSTQLEKRARFLNLPPAVITKGVEQPKAHHAVGFGADQNRFVHQRSQQINQIIQVSVTANIFCCFKFEAAGED